MGVLAALSVFVLIGVIGWDLSQTLRASIAVGPAASARAGPSGAALSQTSSSGGAGAGSDQSAAIGPSVMGLLLQQYSALQNQGGYTAQAGEAAAQQMATQMHTSISYHTYGANELQTTTDTSYARMLSYRADMQQALAPLLKNTRPEFEIFGQYVETSDPSYLAQLRAAAQNYSDAASAAAGVVVPVDAAPYHLAVLNALGEYAATLNAMADNAQDPIASATLLKNYDQGEQDVLTAFSALANYYVHHSQP